MLAAEALVPAHAFQGDSAMRQRLMARLGSMPGSSAAAADLAHAQPGSGRAAVPVQATAAPSAMQVHSASIPDGNARTVNGESPILSRRAGTSKRHHLAFSIYAGEIGCGNLAAMKQIVLPKLCTPFNRHMSL